MVEHLTADTFDEKTKKGKVVIDFYAEWCGPCMQFKPIFEKIAEEMKDIHFFKVNVDEESEIAGKFGVMSIPTIIFLNDGEEKHKSMGALSESSFKKAVKDTFQ